MNEVDLGQLLQTARKKAGYTQQQLCHETGLSYSTLAKIERGAIKSPSIFTIQQIASVLGTSLDDLTGHDSQRTNKTAKKRSKSGVRFVYFDINGCLVRFFHRAFTRIAEESSEPADVIETAFWHLNDAVCKGEITMDKFNQTLGQKFGLSDFDWGKYYIESIEAIEDMQELLKWAASNFNIGLLSNIMPGQIAAMHERGLLPSVDYSTIIASCDVGAIKPESLIYQKAEEAAAVTGPEILLIDDSRTNLIAAEKMDWKVLWFDDYHPAESIARIKSALEL